MLLNVFFFFVRIYTLSSSFGSPWPRLCCWCEDEDEAHSIELKLLLMLILRFVVLLLCLADSLSTSVNNGARKHNWRRRETTLSGGEESSCKSKKIKILALFCSFFLVSKARIENWGCTRIDSRSFSRRAKFTFRYCVNQLPLLFTSIQFGKLMLYFLIFHSPAGIRIEG